MTQDNQPHVEPALPPGLRLHLEQRDRVLRTMEITDDLVARTVDRALAASKPAPAGGAKRRWLLGPVAVAGCVLCFVGGVQWAKPEKPDEPLAYHVHMKKFTGDPAIYLAKDFTAWTQYNQCKASKLNVTCNIGLRQAMVVVNASRCTNDKLCDFLVAERVGDSLGEWATKGMSESPDVDLLSPEWGPLPMRTGSGSGSPEGVAANGSAAAGSAAAGSAVASGSGNEPMFDRWSADHTGKVQIDHHATPPHGGLGDKDMHPAAPLHTPFESATAGSGHPPVF